MIGDGIAVGAEGIAIHDDADQLQFLAIEHDRRGTLTIPGQRHGVVDQRIIIEQLEGQVDLINHVGRWLVILEIGGFRGRKHACVKSVCSGKEQSHKSDSPNGGGGFCNHHSAESGLRP